MVLLEGGEFIAVNYFESVGMLLQLNDLGLAFKALYEDGSYEVFQMMVSGNVLLAVWAMELGVAVYATFKVLRNYHVAPFNERNNKWYVKYKLFDEYQSMPNECWFLTQAEDSCLEKIDQLKPGRAARYGRISIFYLENCHNAYLCMKMLKGMVMEKKKNPLL